MLRHTHHRRITAIGYGASSDMAGFKKRTKKDLDKMAGFRSRTTKDLSQLVDRVDRLASRVDELETERADLAQKLAALTDRAEMIDTRVTSVSGELARQLDELGRELDGATDSATITAALDEVRTAQTRLANEQARHAIAFRADIAILIEQLRR